MNTGATKDREVFRKHWLLIAPRLVWGGLVCSLVFAGGVVLGASSQPALIALVLIPPLAWTIGQALAHYQRTFTVTRDGEIICACGLVSRNQNRVSLHHAHQIHNHQSWLGQRCDFGDIQFVADDTLVHFRGVAHFTRFRQIIEARGTALLEGLSSSREASRSKPHITNGGGQMEKEITVVVPGTGDEREARDLAIKSGTTAADVLQAIGLDPARFQLQLKRGQEFESLAGADNVYGKAENGEKLFAMPRDIVVG